MSINDHLRAMWDRIVVIVLLAVIGAGVGYWAASSQPHEYQSTTLIALGPKKTFDSSLSSTTQALLDRSVPSTLAQVATSASTIDLAASTTGISPTAMKVDAVVANDSNVVQVTVTGPNPTDTQRFADAATTQAMTRFTNLYPIFRTLNIGPAAAGVETTVSPTLGAAAGGVVGLLVGILISLAMGRRQRPLAVVEQGARKRAAG